MASLTNVTIHSSQFPESVRRALLGSLRERRINHKFHYDSFKQTQQWLALHEAHSPARSDADCAAIYDRSFAAVAARVQSEQVHIVGLGCGGGQKDTRLIDLLTQQGHDVLYTPCDVSVPMVLTAREKALTVIRIERCFPLVCDLAETDEWQGMIPDFFKNRVSRITTFFGMIPNFEPQNVLPKLADLIGPYDCLLFSANLAPGADYTRGMESILPQYDNALTRDWLMTFLLDLGVERDDGELRFSIESGEFQLKRVVACFHFTRKRRIEIDSENFVFKPGDSIQLFFSYRYTPDLARQLLPQFGIEVVENWITSSEEEAVFLCRRKSH